MISNINLSTKPTGLYHYYDANIIYKQSQGLDGDSCTKIKYVTDETSPDLKPIEGLTYKNAEKITVTYTLNSENKVVNYYLDSLIQDGDKLSSSKIPTPNAKHRALPTGNASATYTAYVKNYYTYAVSLALANGETPESIYNKLPDYVKYTTTASKTLVQNETAKTSTSVNPGLTRTVTWIDNNATVTYTISEALKNAVENIIKQDVVEYANKKLKNIEKEATDVTFTYPSA